MAENRELPLYAELFGIKPDKIYLEKYFRLSELLEHKEHKKIMKEVAREYDSELRGMKGFEFKGHINNVDILQDYKAYLIHPYCVGIVLGRIVADGPEKNIEKQTVYVHSFNYSTDIVNEIIDYLAKEYSTRGARILPEINFTYNEIVNTSSKLIGWNKASAGMDVATDIGLLERDTELQVRFSEGNKMLVTTYNIPKELEESMTEFTELIFEKDKSIPKDILPRFISSKNFETSR